MKLEKDETTRYHMMQQIKENKKMIYKMDNDGTLRYEGHVT